MKQSNYSSVHRIGAIAVATIAASVFIGAPALADDPDPAEQDTSCGAAVRKFANAANAVLKGDAKDDANSLGGKYSGMRNACAPFRACKQECRIEKRKAKDECKDLRGKAKRKCKREARREKRSCKSGCRDEMQQSGCKDARREFWGTMGKVARKVAKDKNVRQTGKAAINICRDLYKE